MSTYNDYELNNLAHIFLSLDDRYAVYRSHKLTFEQFIANPADNERWIVIYFANPALFSHVSLVLFLTQGPATVLQGALAMAQARRESLTAPLLERQQAAMHLFDVEEAFIAQEDLDAPYDAHHFVEHRGDHYFEKINIERPRRMKRSKNPHTGFIFKHFKKVVHG